MATVSVVHTGKDGALVDGGQQAVDAIFRRLAGEGLPGGRPAAKVILHFHGGLVDRAKGLEGAARLDAAYRRAGAEPVFFVWESGLLEVLRHNLAEIAGEDLFKVVLKWVTKFAVGKVNEAAGIGGRGIELQVPNDVAVYTELEKRRRNEEPYGSVDVSGRTDELTDEQRAEFERQVAEDPEFQDTAAAIAASVLPQPVERGSRGVTTEVRASGRSLISPDVLDELVRDEAAARAAGHRGLLTSAVFVRHAGRVLARVVKRYSRKRDHGLYPTIVEEILREFYVANVGVGVWRAMKGETKDTFSADAPLRGGYYFARKLAELATSGHRPQVTLVGHSTGAVFINNLLFHLQELRAANPAGYPADWAIDNVVFLAPACTHADFARYVTKPYHDSAAGGTPLFRNLRIFTMTDDAECRDVLVPFVYTRSLLYFVSGVLEPDESGVSAPDVPIVGMERYHARASHYPRNDFDAVHAVREFVRSDVGRLVLSPSAQGAPGRTTRSLKHGDFDNDPDTLDSIVHLVQHGY